VTSALGRLISPCRALLLLVALAVLAAGFTVAAPDIAAAQQEVRRPWFDLRNLFQPRRANRVERRVIRREAPPKARKKRTVRRREAAEPRKRTLERAAEEAVAKVEKKEDALTVMVVGDFLGGGLAEGLEEVFAENPLVRVIDRSSGSSGFVRDDYYDWPENIVELIETEKPAAIAIMLGGNDRQQMRIGSERETLRSENWDREYGERAKAFAKAIADRKVPFIWVGVPAFKSQKMMTDMLAFNDFYRTAAEEAGAEFVDIWDGFVDENGAFASNGPDINGQPVRLRSGDGINLTRPGKRKVAFYAEKPLAKLLGEAAMQGVAAAGPDGVPGAATPPVDVGSIERTAPISLSDPELDGGTELMGAVVAPKENARSPGEKLAVEGMAPKATPGRADDFSRQRSAPMPGATSAIGR